MNGINWLRRLDLQQTRSFNGRTRMGPKLNASPGNQSLWQRVISLLNPENFRRVATREVRGLLSPRVVPKRGDILVFSDVWWFEQLIKLQQVANQQGVRTGIIVYDLLPIRHPEFFPKELEQKFRHFLDRYLLNSHFLMTISETVASDLRNYAQERFGDRCARSLRIDSFRLGSDLDLASQTNDVDPRVQEFFASTDQPVPYLTVGTVEPRKNHRYLLDAFDKLWRSCPSARLCILGRPGWLNEDTIRRIESHPRIGRQLIWFSNASDTDLLYCYKHAKALLFASKAEGFGLPLVEGLRHGLPVVASDIPVHREAGGGYCSYFDLLNSDSLASILVKVETTGELPKVETWSPDLLVDWSTSGREFLEKCRQLAENSETIHP